MVKGRKKTFISKSSRQVGQFIVYKGEREKSEARKNTNNVERTQVQKKKKRGRRLGKKRSSRKNNRILLERSMEKTQVCGLMSFGCNLAKVKKAVLAFSS